METDEHADDEEDDEQLEEEQEGGSPGESLVTLVESWVTRVAILVRNFVYCLCQGAFLVQPLSIQPQTVQ